MHDSGRVAGGVHVHIGTSGHRGDVALHHPARGQLTNAGSEARVFGQGAQDRFAGLGRVLGQVSGDFVGLG